MREIYDAVFVRMWPWYIGGPAIGLFVIVFLLIKNRLLSVSSTYQFLIDKITITPSSISNSMEESEPNWLGYFFIGLFLGGLLSSALSGNLEINWKLTGFEDLYRYSLLTRALILGFAGLLIGFGTRMSGGCTSGHCIVGVSGMQIPSLFATCVFFALGIVVSYGTEIRG